MSFFVFLKAEQLYSSFDVVAIHQSKLALEIGGIVSEIFVEPSSIVKKGDVLLKLDSTSEQIALKAAKNDYALANVAFQNAKSRFNKFKEVKEFIDKQSFEDIKAKYESAQLNLQKARLNIQHYENIIDKKSLKAPFDGVIARKFVDLGQAVAPVSMVLFEIFSYPDVKLILSFDEKYKDEVKLGQEFIYKIDGSKDEFKGKIALIYPSVDIKTRKIYAEVKAKGFMPGLFGEGYIQIPNH